jgi:hypothetical protein
MFQAPSLRANIENIYILAQTLCDAHIIENTPEPEGIRSQLLASNGLDIMEDDDIGGISTTSEVVDSSE